MDSDIRGSSEAHSAVQRIKPLRPHPPFMHTIEAKIVPKDVHPARLYADLHSWWCGHKTGSDLDQVNVLVHLSQILFRPTSRHVGYNDGHGAVTAEKG